MSRLHFTYPRNSVPPDNLRFQHVDGHQSVACDVATWYAKIEKHEKDNGRELAPDWKEAAQDQLCRILPPGWCSYDNGEVPSTFVNVRIGRDEFLRGMKVLTAIAVDDNPIVPQELAESRAKTCASCPANVNIDGCSACSGIANIIASIKGANRTEADPLLKACAACGCSNKSQVHIRADLLRKGVDEKQMTELRSIPWCWKAKEIDSLP